MADMLTKSEYRSLFPAGYCLFLLQLLFFLACAAPRQTIDPVDGTASRTADMEMTDSTPPQIVLMTGSGNSITGQTGSVITVKGYVTDDGEVTDFHVDSRRFQLPADGTFALIKEIMPGRSTVLLEAIDGGLNRTETVLTIHGVTQTEEPAETTRPEKRLALVIGNGAYKHASRLTNPGNDAVDIAKRLKRLGFEVMVYRNLNLDRMKRRIDEFGRRLKSFEVGLIFYAGHGAQAGGMNYLFPVDANPSSENDVEFHCVRMDRIIGKMEDAGSLTNIVILDACRDNPFERSWTRSARGRGLAAVTAPRGTYIAYATAPGSTAFDGVGRNGIYTASLLRTIGTPDIPIEDLFKVVRSKVLNMSKGKQLTWDASSLIGQFKFNPDGIYK